MLPTGIMLQLIGDDPLKGSLSYLLSDVDMVGFWFDLKYVVEK